MQHQRVLELLFLAHVLAAKKYFVKLQDTPDDHEQENGEDYNNHRMFGCPCGKDVNVNRASDYIVGGRQLKEKEVEKYPWFVKILTGHTNGETFICGGSIISR